MIARKSALIMATQVLNGILGYIAIFLVARYMNVADPDYALGVVAFAYGLVAIFHIFEDLGFNQAHVKRVSEGQDLGTCNGTFVALKVVLTAFMVVLLMGSVWFWKNVVGRGFESPQHETAVYVMLLYFVLWSVSQIMLQTFKARREIAKDQLPFFMETLFRVIATVYVVFAGYGVIALAWTYVVGEVAILLTSLYFFRGYPIKRPSWQYVKMYATFAIPLAIVVASTKVMTNVDKVLIQLFWGAAEGGNYFAIYRLSRFLDMATLAIGTLLFPTMSALHARTDLGGIKRLSYTAERYLSMVIFPIVFFMIFMARPVIHIMLSNKFYPAIPILQILPIFALFDALEKPYQMKLLGMSLPKFARNRVLLMVALNVALNILLIPRDIQMLGVRLAGMGAVGAAIATVIAYLAGLVYTRWVVWRVSRMAVNWRIGLHFLAALAMGLTLATLYQYFPVGRWYELAAVGLLGLGLYLGLLALMREFTRADLDLFMDTLNIRKMGRYVREELRGK